MALDTTPITVSPSLNEALRQVSICNACRYCEGYCSVFPAIHRQRSFDHADITQLANLCHNCRGCYYACQYTEPHEFAINLPNALAEARLASWEEFTQPALISRLFQRSGLVLSLSVIIGIAFVLMLAMNLQPDSGVGFYAHLSHTLMISVFIPAFVLPLWVIANGVRSYWRAVGGAPVRLQHIVSAVKSAATMKNLDGGQGQGCNYEHGDRFSHQRRLAHQLAMGGFLLCFASTTSGTVLHYVLGIEAPYPLISIPKFLGVPGGILLTLGCGWLAWLKLQADEALGSHGVWGGEMAFVLLLGATGATGLALYAATGTAAVQSLLALHLGTVLTFFLSMPYSKMVHGFYRFAALIREAQLTQASA
ncbi:MAG: tricarballylate utilization 4Fe-4S protein TcuB [Gammaproteobacteria bacterium]|nr:tricarballylate utilization 4Fe-4S protein TcuB [Gammaproteobacteria bacterium]